MMNFFTRATLDEDLAKIPLLSNAPKRPVDFVCLKTMEGQLSGSEESSKVCMKVAHCNRSSLYQSSGNNKKNLYFFICAFEKQSQDLFRVDFTLARH